MLPPPLTMAICSPAFAARAISFEYFRRLYGSSPFPSGPPRLSPLSLSKTLLYIALSSVKNV